MKAEALKELEEADRPQLSIDEAEWQVAAGLVGALGLEMERREYLGGLLTMMAPVAFDTVRPINGGPLMPAAVLSDPQGSVRVVIDHGKAACEPSQVGQSVEQAATMLEETGIARRVHKAGVTDIGGRQVGHIEYFGPGEGGDSFTALFQESVGGMALTMLFTCGMDVARSWRNVFWAIVRTSQTREPEALEGEG
jgi:hypothetical protein